jgi:Zn-dependent protease with chaperone function
MQGTWFDGQSSRGRAVHVSIDAGRKGAVLRMAPQDGGAAASFAAHEIEWPESWSAKLRGRRVTIDLRDAGTLEIDDSPELHAAFHSAGGRMRIATRMQTRWRAFLAVFAVAALGIFAFYRWGTPWAAALVTGQVPLSWELSLSENALAQLDSSWLHPSKLSAERKAQLTASFQKLARGVDPSLQRYRGYAPGFTLAFRDGLGPNAFALPGGTIVMTDALVEEAARDKLGDDALMGVLAHEIGHVVHRHTTRLVVEQAVLNVGLGLALGDVSSLVSLAGSALTGLAYQRSHESEADCFSVALLRKDGLATAPMADLLLALEAHRAPPAAKGTSAFDLLSSHPATHERALALRSGRGA